MEFGVVRVKAEVKEVDEPGKLACALGEQQTVGGDRGDESEPHGRGEKRGKVRVEERFPSCKVDKPAARAPGIRKVLQNLCRLRVGLGFVAAR